MRGRKKKNIEYSAFESSSEHDSSADEKDLSESKSKQRKSSGLRNSLKSTKKGQEAEEEEEQDVKKKKRKSSKLKGSRSDAVKVAAKLDSKLVALLEELNCMDSAAQAMIEAGITYQALLQFTKDDLSQLNLPLGPRVAIWNHIEKQKSFNSTRSLIEKANIKATDLTFDTMLGGGNFGDVWMGKLRGTTTVAIKTIRSEDKTAFIQEAQIMADLPAHPNVVTFFGLASSDDTNELYLVTEFVVDGSLDKYLVNHINKIEEKALIQMAKDVAAGMDHLATQGIIHRDLAARNLLVEVKRNGEHRVKVCDFGLSRGLVENEYSSQMKNIPIRWTALEAFKYKKYTSKSDVWSYGVTVWEIFSFGQTPYTEMTPLECLQAIRKGYKLPRPDNCPKRLYEEVILRCLQDDPEERPTFREIYKKLEELYPNNVVSEEEIAEKKLGRSENYREQDDIVVVEDAKVMNSGTTYDDYPSEYPSEIPLLRDRRGEESEQLKEWEKEEAGKLQKGKKGRKGTVSKGKGKGTKKVKSNKRDKDPMPSKIPTGEPQPEDQELGNAEKEAMTEYGDNGNDENKHQGKGRENEKIPDKKEAIISMLTQYGDEGPFDVAATTDKKSDSERAEKQKEKETSIRLLTQYDDGSEGASAAIARKKLLPATKRKRKRR